MQDKATEFLELEKRFEKEKAELSLKINKELNYSLIKLFEFVSNIRSLFEYCHFKTSLEAEYFGIVETIFNIEYRCRKKQPCPPPNGEAITGRNKLVKEQLEILYSERLKQIEINFTIPEIKNETDNLTIKHPHFNNLCEALNTEYLFKTDKEVIEIFNSIRIEKPNGIIGLFKNELNLNLLNLPDKNNRERYLKSLLNTVKISDLTLNVYNLQINAEALANELIKVNALNLTDSEKRLFSDYFSGKEPYYSTWHFIYMLECSFKDFADKAFFTQQCKFFLDEYFRNTICVYLLEQIELNNPTPKAKDLPAPEPDKKPITSFKWIGTPELKEALYKGLKNTFIAQETSLKAFENIFGEVVLDEIKEPVKWLKTQQKNKNESNIRAIVELLNLLVKNGFLDEIETEYRIRKQGNAKTKIDTCFIKFNGKKISCQNNQFDTANKPTEFYTELESIVLSLKNS